MRISKVTWNAMKDSRGLTDRLGANDHRPQPVHSNVDKHPKHLCHKAGNPVRLQHGWQIHIPTIHTLQQHLPAQKRKRIDPHQTCSHSGQICVVCSKLSASLATSGPAYHVTKCTAAREQVAVDSRQQ